MLDSKTSFSSAFLRRSLFLIVPALMTGCGVPWTVIKQSGPPSALKGASQVVVSFDYTGMMVGGMAGDKPEAQWVAEKSAEEEDYAKTWGDVKGSFEQNYVDEFTAHSPIAATRGQVGAPVPDNAVGLVVKLSNFQIGKYLVFGAKQSTVTVVHTWMRGGAVVDEIQTRSVVTPSLVNPSIQKHVVGLGGQSGEFAAAFLEDAIEN